jgi:hypothetical protein
MEAHVVGDEPIEACGYSGGFTTPYAPSEENATFGEAASGESVHGGRRDVIKSPRKFLGDLFRDGAEMLYGHAAPSQVLFDVVLQVGFEGLHDLGRLRHKDHGNVMIHSHQVLIRERVIEVLGMANKAQPGSQWVVLTPPG